MISLLGPASGEKPVDLRGEKASDVDLVMGTTDTRQRRLFFTQPGTGGTRGLMGLGPFGMRPGYSVWMLKDGRLHYVRKETKRPATLSVSCLDLTSRSLTSVTVSEGDTTCSLVGDHYISGLMDGEILDYLGKEPKKARPTILEAMDHDFRQVWFL